MERYYIGDEIEIRPAVPAEMLAGTRFTAEGVEDHSGEVVVTNGYRDDHSLVVPPHDERLTSSPGSIVDDVQALVDLLGAGYTYSGELRIVDPNEEPPSRVRVVKAGGSWTAVQEESEYIYPADYAVPDGPAVVFDAAAARAWLTEPSDGGVTRASEHYNIDPDGTFDPIHNSPGDWLERLLNDLTLAEPPAPHVWRTAPGVAVEVVETVGVEEYADGGAVLIVEVGGLRVASRWLEWKDLATYEGDERGHPTGSQIDAAVETLGRAAQVVNEVVERHRLVRAADVAARTTLSVVGGMVGRLTLAEVECALRTLADLWDGNDPHDVLSDRQRQIAGRLAELRAAEEAEERGDDLLDETGDQHDQHLDEG